MPVSNELCRNLVKGAELLLEYVKPRALTTADWNEIDAAENAVEAVKAELLMNKEGVE